MNSKDHKIPFGLKDGHSISAEEADRGGGCNCICSLCDEKLINCKGEIVLPYFRHESGSDCVGGYESSLHLEAKEILSKIGKIMLPAVYASIGMERIKIYRQQLLEFNSDSVFYEKKLKGIRPDLIIEKNGTKLLIEIYVTHKVDENKKKKVMDMDVSMIEINLSKMKRGMPIDMIRAMLLNELTEKSPKKDIYNNKQWVYNSKANKITEEVRQYVTEKTITQIRNPYHHSHYFVYCDIVNNCPKDKYGGDEFTWNCDSCNYCFSKNSKSVFCTGHHRDAIDKIIQKNIKW